VVTVIDFKPLTLKAVGSSPSNDLAFFHVRKLLSWITEHSFWFYSGAPLCDLCLKNAQRGTFGLGIFSTEKLKCCHISSILLVQQKKQQTNKKHKVCLNQYPLVRVCLLQQSLDFIYTQSEKNC
jgi:hypothetical protein